jgi:Flp pilus assembly protein TadG
MADLITLSNYKIAEGIQSTKDDSKIESIIARVSQLVRTYCGNGITTYHTSAKTETLSVNWASNIVQLTESPLVGVTSVKERENLSDSYTTLVENTDYYVDYSTDSIYRVSSSGAARNWANGPGAVQVVYTAGYENCPADLELAVIDLITYYVKDEHKARQTIAGASIQNQSSSSQRNNVAFPDHIKRVLDLYKNF